jgi:hypothetical protein
MPTKHKAPAPQSPYPTSQESFPTLINQLRALIDSARKQALRAVDALQVRTCWEIGRHIVEFEQQGQDRATYGARLIPKLCKIAIAAEFGRGFDVSSLAATCGLFYVAFQIRDALRQRINLATHYRHPAARVKTTQARH